MNISHYLKAGYPCLFIVTEEPLRATVSIHTDDAPSYSWDCLRGITDRVTGKIIEDVIDPLQAVKWLAGRSDTVLFMQNFHHFIPAVEIIQEIQNCLPIWKASGCCLVMVGPQVDLPVEIAGFFTMLDFHRPSSAEVRRIQQELAKSVDVETDEESIEESIQAALGLTEFEIETAFALSLVMKRKFCPEVIKQQKMQMIKRTGLMEFWPPVPEDQVGGLDLFKTYLINRRKAFEPGYDYLPRTRGMLLIGIPGTGKSLSCKAAASILGWPLIRLDISSLKGSLVGESEQRMRQATNTIDAFGSAVVWLDEIDKAFAGVKSSGRTDGGTTSAMFGHFLTWMQETLSPIIVMATANSIGDLPPEFLRAGRFDATFFVDLPTHTERKEIIQIMNKRYRAEIPEDKCDALEGWTGAEIEQMAKDSLFDGLEDAMANIVPLSRTMKEEIGALQQWALTRARRANSPEPAESSTIRRIR